VGGLGVAKSIHAADTTFESVTCDRYNPSTTTGPQVLNVQGGGLGV
jgi:hypothetical protein